jgi:hypothetical protein
MISINIYSKYDIVNKTIFIYEYNDILSLYNRIVDQKLFLEQAADYFNVPETVISDLADRGIIKTYYINNVKQFKCSEIEEHIINNSIEGGFYE